ncbi:hypothetical protein COB55_01185 [Candidatus Wolfebacteria bacterium]|nr:MAG: hypothetical protein COB55_01185 [Candidatus Wolfebacteria bacterium]
MSASKEFVEYILDLLSPIDDVTTARMFGGALLKVHGKQLGVLFGETVYFKVTDETLQKHYASEGSKQFTYTRKDKKDPVIIKNWWSVPEYAMDNSEEMVRLAEEVLGQEK